MPPNWALVDKCGIWKVLGVIECDGCLSSVECWGEETILPESPEGQTHLAELFLGAQRERRHTMILQSGREVPDFAYEAILDKLIRSIIIEYATFEFESLDDAIDLIIRSLQEDGSWLPDSCVFSYEEAVELVDTVKTVARYFANDLSDAYSELSRKYVGTKSWELYR